MIPVPRVDVAVEHDWREVTVPERHDDARVGQPVRSAGTAGGFDDGLRDDRLLHLGVTLFRGPSVMVVLRVVESEEPIERFAARHAKPVAERIEAHARANVARNLPPRSNATRSANHAVIGRSG